MADACSLSPNLPPSVELDPELLQHFLEWAGLRLIAMPGGRTAPSRPKVAWPSYNQDRFEVLDFRGALSLRAAAPSREEIPIVELILALPNLCSEAHVRRVLHARALVHPLNRRYIFPWTRIAKLLQTDRRTVQRWHMIGLRQACRLAPPSVVGRITQHFLSASGSN